MPKLSPATQARRRAHILDAAELCFARAGFHRTSMQDICREAGVSAGALYVYFASKEALIAGIAERDRQKLAEQLAALAGSRDLAGALSALGEHYAVEEPPHKRVLCMEIGLESTRNEAVGEIYRSVDTFLKESFEGVFVKAASEGRINPVLDPKALATIVAIIGDGLFWRRAVDPSFDPRTVIPAINSIVAGLLNPTEVALPSKPCVPSRRAVEPKSKPRAAAKLVGARS